MNVRVCILYRSPTEEDLGAMRSLAYCLTNNRDSVRVFADPQAEGWLVAEFTMPTEAQYKALPAIERAIRLYRGNGLDIRFSFPRTEAERVRAARRAARRRARRRREA